MIGKILMAILIFIVFPELLGLLIVRFTKNEKYNVILALILGYLIIFGILEILTIRAIYSGITLTNTINILVMIVMTFSFISIWINRNSFTKMFKSLIMYVKEMPKVLTVIAIVLIFIQVFFPVRYAHIDDDDSYYVGAATTAVENDSILQYDAYTGVERRLENPKYALGAFLSYYAVCSVLINVHPAIVAHLILPVIFIPLSYMVMYLVLNEIFDDNKKKVWTSLIFLSIISIFGNFSSRSSFTFLLFRIWQGKAMMANFIVPTTILLVLKAEKNGYKLIYCIMLFLTSLGGLYTTTMAIGFIPITLMVLSFCIELSKISLKEWKRSLFNLFKCLICCAPCFIMCLMYIKLSKG